MRSTRAAVALLTRIPVGGFPYSGPEWRWAAAAFPFVGAGIGLLLSAFWWLCRPVGPLPAALLVYALSLLITGALHEDGLADTADALGGGGNDRERIFAILKDSRVGAYGALALVLSVALRASLLAGLADHAPAGLVLSHTLARVGPVWLLTRLPSVTPTGVRSGAVVETGATQVAIAIGLGGVVLAGVAVVTGGMWAIRTGVLLAGLMAVVGFAGRLFRKRAGGITGDFLGSVEQVGEVAVLAILILVGN